LEIEKTVDEEFDAGDEPAVIGGGEGDGFGDFAGGAQVRIEDPPSNPEGWGTQYENGKTKMAR
jgi:hypothetical protein